MIGVGNEGHLFSFDLTIPQNRNPINTRLGGIEDIRDIQKMQNYSNKFFICTTEGIHFMEIVKNPRGILNFKLLGSKDGHAALSTFPLHDKKILTAVEIRPNHVIVAVEGMATFYVIDGDTRLAIQAVKNPSNMRRLCSMKKVPGYDPQHRPYVLFKDGDYVSLFNTRLMKLLPLVRSKYDTDPLNVHNLWVTNNTVLDRKNTESFNHTN